LIFKKWENTLSTAAEG